MNMEKLIKKFESKIYTGALWDSDEKLKASRESAEYCVEECKKIALEFQSWLEEFNIEPNTYWITVYGVMINKSQLFDKFIEEYYKEEIK